jgi:nucleoside-diphosphate-sugar epimerase
VRCFDWEELEQIPWGEVDAVVHLAGKAHDTRNASDPQSYFDVNVGLTKKVISSLVHYCVSASVGKQEAIVNKQSATGNDSTNVLPKFLLFSSVKAVADRVEGVLTEEAVPAPQTPYGQSKLEAEGVVRSSLVHYCASALVERAEGGESVGNKQPAIGNDSTNERMNSRTNELFYYILRPCMIHGPGNKGNLNLLYGVVSKGVPWPLGAFENRRSFASIGNVCAVVEGLLTGSAPAGVYQVADDEALATNELIGLMAETLGRRARVWRVPAGLIRWAARCGDALRLPLNSERLKKLTESYVVSNAKIKKALGWEAMPVRAEEGMRKTLESFGISSLTEAQRSQRSF